MQFDVRQALEPLAKVSVEIKEKDMGVNLKSVE